ncbi:twin-arginine translocase subunit TatC, partial [Staphylococcus warneri]
MNTTNTQSSPPVSITEIPVEELEKMSFTEHLVILRRHLFKTVALLLILFFCL